MVGTFIDGPLPVWAIVLYQVVTMLSYTNSALNPLLYAFLTDNFRRTLAASFQRGSRTATSSLVARGLAICAGAVSVGVRPPLTPAADRPPGDDTAAAAAVVAPGSGPSEGPRDDDDDGDGGVRSISRAPWLLDEHGNQSSSIELDVFYDVSISRHSFTTGRQ